MISTAVVAMTGTTTEDLTINSTGEIESATVASGAANTIFDTMKDPSAESNELTLTLNVAKTGETTTAAGTTVALEIDMTAVMEKTAAGVTTTTTDNVTSFSDFITIEYQLGLNKENVVATHKGHEMQALSSASATPTDEINGGYYYNPLTGILTIRTKTLSPFAVTYTTAQSGPDADEMKTPIPQQTIDVVASFSDLGNTVALPLAAGVKFTAPEEPEEEYADWNADFVISFDKDMDLLNLADAFGSDFEEFGSILPILPVGMFSEEAESFWSSIGGYWLPCLLRESTLEHGSEGYKAGENIVLLNTAVSQMLGMSGLSVTYDELCHGVEEFSCGVVCLQDIGNVKVTVSLVLYDPQNFDMEVMDPATYHIASSQIFNINTAAHLPQA